MKRQITRLDIMPLDQYAKVRRSMHRELTALKENRRVHVGPDVTAYFECYETMWHQVQEMLYIEKGGDEQLEGELAAYNPLIPSGRELVATLMFEIDDAARRHRVLAGLGGVEETVALRFDGETVKGRPETDVDRTTADGKASSVQFIHFPFTDGQIAKFRTSGLHVMLAIEHPRYHHLAVLPEPVRAALAGDFDP